MHQSSLLSFSQLSIIQKVNSWHKLLIQVCQEADQKHAEFSSVLHEVQQVFCIRLVARYRRIFFERKMPFEKMWKILLLYLLHVSIVKQSLILF